MNFGEGSYFSSYRNNVCDCQRCRVSVNAAHVDNAASKSSSPTFDAEMKELEEGLEEALEKMSKEAHDEDAAVFLGTTKAGKSTLVNFAIGNELIGEKAEEFLPVAVRMVGRSSAGPAIGAASNSETVVPTRWGDARRLQGLVIWDAPGFGDNRSPVQDIINAYYIFTLIQHLRSLRIVLVVDLNDIVADRISPFIELLECVEKLLGTQMRRCFSSIVVVFNKVPKELNKRPLDVSVIGEILKHKILSDSKLAVSPMGRELVQHLVNNNRQIGLFGLVSQAGPIGDDLDRGVSRAILATESIDARSLREVIFPSLAEHSITFLNRAREKLSSDSAFQELLQEMDRCAQDAEHYFRERDRQHGTCEHFKKESMQFIWYLQQILDPKINTCRKLMKLDEHFPALRQKIAKDDLLKKSRLLSFVEYILEGQRVQTQRAFDLSLNSFLDNLRRSVETLLRDSKRQRNFWWRRRNRWSSSSDSDYD